MHPSYSVILFTTAAGAGYGLLVWLAFAVILGVLPATGAVSTIGLILSLALVSIGLLSSTLHLGRPERAWRAVTQWQTSWLSREGVLALATYVPAGLWLLAAFFSISLWWIASAALALATAIGALATVWCTGMIYQSLPTIRAWSDSMVTPIYVLLALATGAALLALLQALTVASIGTISLIAALLLIAAAPAKWVYWQRIDNKPRTWTAGSATGLAALGTVRPLEPPHTQPNFVMREMGYRVARRHAEKLRFLTIGVGFLAPAALLLLASYASPTIALLAVVVAVIGIAVGVLVERWLFFAEAEHVVQVYYGAERV